MAPLGRSPEVGRRSWGSPVLRAPGCWALLLGGERGGEPCTPSGPPGAAHTLLLFLCLNRGHHGPMDGGSGEVLFTCVCGPGWGVPSLGKWGELDIGGPEQEGSHICRPLPP